MAWIASFMSRTVAGGMAAVLRAIAAIVSCGISSHALQSRTPA